jgi:GNAT superfamily N-acetyltransferase
MAGTFEIVRTSTGDPQVVTELLRGLPEWFGIEDALLGYAERAGHQPTFTALEGGRSVGVLVVCPHGEVAAEMDVLAVHRHHHRRGVGRALVAAAEQDLRARGVDHLQVKTLGPSRPSPAYEQTRRFYLSLGYTPIEEFAAGTVWDDDPCLLLVKHLPCEVTARGAPRSP